MKRLYVPVILCTLVLLLLVGNANALPALGQAVQLFDSPTTMLFLGAGLASLASYSRKGKKK